LTTHGAQPRAVLIGKISGNLVASLNSTGDTGRTRQLPLGSAVKLRDAAD